MTCLICPVLFFGCKRETCSNDVDTELCGVSEAKVEFGFRGVFELQLSQFFSGI